VIIVLDANAGIEIALDREKSKILNSFIEVSSKVITSDLYKAETTNVLYKYIKAGLLKKHEAIEKLNYCEMIVDYFIDIKENQEESLLESIRLNHSVYDLLYLTLARRNGARLITLDKKLNKLAKESGIETIEDE
jgi:predicted nucleic acid-binding protein